MDRMRRLFEHYSDNAASYAQRYESVTCGQVHAAWLHLLSARGGLALDVGAGSGRDAGWLAAHGWDVVAVEPSDGLLDEARRRHPSAKIRWLRDALPTLKETHRLDLRFDLILLSAVWMHLNPRNRERAYRKLSNLLRPGGLLVITLRHGEPDPRRDMYPVDTAELVRLGRRLALEPVALGHADVDDALGRDLRWSTHVFRLPDDGTGALPLLRHITINDRKSSTYKLALLRVLLRIADGSRGMVLRRSEDGVTLPFGLVALYWLKAFKPLVGAGTAPAEFAVADRAPGFPQQSNRSVGLGFAGEAFRALSGVSPHDLRVGSRFTGSDASNLARALNDICRTITRMPATYTTFPGSDTPVFKARPTGIRTGKAVVLDVDSEFLARFGVFTVPVHLWEAISRYACWIEPAILAEWCRMMQSYDKAAGIVRSLDEYMDALKWLEPERDTASIRARVEALRAGGSSVYCVWTGSRLRDRFEIDHCFPFSFWPNNDLWNLLPSSQAANGQKRDRLPSSTLLQRSRGRILDWWHQAYEAPADLDRFRTEALASLPLSAVLAGTGDLHDSVFIGMDNQRLRLRSDQQLAEWEGPLTRR